MKYNAFLCLCLFFLSSANGTEIYPRIYGGEYTNEYASVAWIVANPATNAICAGVLIGARTLLTAAHCLHDDNGQERNIKDMEVYFQNAGKIFSVEEKYVHKDYTSLDSKEGLTNDIALIVLSGSGSIRIQPANIVRDDIEKSDYDTTAALVGFGRRGDNNNPGLKKQGEFSLELYARSLFDEDEKCTRLFDQDTQFCLRDSSPVHTCKGDSGGPLFLTRGGNYYVAGIASYGYSGNCTQKTTYYTKISKFSDWIEERFVEDIGGNIGSSALCQKSACLPPGKQLSCLVNCKTSGNEIMSIEKGENKIRLSIPDTAEELFMTFNYNTYNLFPDAVKLLNYESYGFDCNSISNATVCYKENITYPGDFELVLDSHGEYKNSTQRTTTIFLKGDNEKHAILLLDHTGSMSDENATRATGNSRCVDSLTKARDDIDNFFDESPPGSSMAVWVFNGTDEEAVNLTNGFKGYAEAQSAVDSLVFEDCTSSTPLADALCQAGDELEQVFPDALPKNRLLILSTDGGENSSSGKCSDDQSGGSWQDKVKDQLKNQIVLKAHFWGDELGLAPRAFDSETGTLVKRAALEALSDQNFLADLARITGGSFTAISDNVAALPAPVSVLKDTTIGLYQPGMGRLLLRDGNIGGPADHNLRFGPTANVMKALAGDWNGDGFDTIGVYHPNRGLFYLKESIEGGGADHVLRFGPNHSEIIPLAGDWDGDGFDTIGIYRPSQGRFFLRNRLAGGAADEVLRFGPTGGNLKAVAGDWDGDGYDSVGVYNPLQGTFYLKNSLSGGKADNVIRFGPTGPAMKPIAGDWDGDGFDSIGVYHPGRGVFYLKNSLAGGNADHVVHYGPIGGEVWPVVGDWIKPLQRSRAFATLYREDFFDAPGYLTATSANAQGKCSLAASDGSYFVEVRDQPGAWHCIATSPAFTDVRSFADFEIEFDFNPVRPGRGHYPGIYLYPRLLDAVDKIENHPSRIKFSIDWSDAIFKQFSLVLGDKTYRSPSIPGTNEWYRVKIAYAAGTDEVDWTIKRQNGSQFHEAKGLAFPTFTSMGRLSIGEIQGSNRYGESAVIRVDNLRIGQQY